MLAAVATGEGVSVFLPQDPPPRRASRRETATDDGSERGQQDAARRAGADWVVETTVRGSLSGSDAPILSLRIVDARDGSIVVTAADCPLWSGETRN
jgi:hypothetical protein